MKMEDANGQKGRPYLARFRAEDAFFVGIAVRLITKAIAATGLVQTAVV